jgi:hypothetical protein
MFEAGLFSVAFEILDEGVRGERRAGLARPVVSCPEGTLRLENVFTPARAEIV